MKKITLKLALFSIFGLFMFSINAQTFYYEDFRYEDDRGFTVQKVALGSQTATDVGKRVGDIVDAADSSPMFDESSRPATRIPQGGARDQRTISFKNISGSTPNFVNHELEAWALMTNQDLSKVNAPKVSFWTQQRFVIGGGAALTILVSQNYMHGMLPSTATWTDETANITGAIATSDVSPQTFVYGELDLSSYKGTSVTIAFRVLTDNTAYNEGVNQHGTFYISDVNFKATPQDVANGDFSALNTSSSGQTNVFNTPSPSTASNNFSNTTKWAAVLATDGSVPRLAKGVLIPIGEGYKFEVASKYNPVVISEVRFQTVNGHNTKGTPGNSMWIMQGSVDDLSWDTLSSPIEMVSSLHGVETASTLTITKAYRYYRFVLSTAWTPNQAFTALQQLDFTVDSSVLSNEKRELEDAFTIHPNPTNSVINISNTTIAIKSVRLIDIIGKVIYNNTNAHPIDVRSFSKGLYILNIESIEGGTVSKKVIIN